MGQQPIRKVICWGLLTLGMMWFSITATHLWQGAQRPPDAILMLGGSIRREIYVAEQRAQGFDRPIFISQGSVDPCIYLLFQQAQADLDEIWLETCADSTFDNFRYGLPLLKERAVRRVRVVTSPTHVPRARWLAQTMLGSHGIWVEMDLVTEKGVPGNQESRLKTALDMIRALGWAVLSQVYTPSCPQVKALAAVDIALWHSQGFQCEHQSGIEGSPGKQD